MPVGIQEGMPGAVFLVLQACQTGDKVGKELGRAASFVATGVVVGEEVIFGDQTFSESFPHAHFTEFQLQQWFDRLTESVVDTQQVQVVFSGHGQDSGSTGNSCAGTTSLEAGNFTQNTAGPKTYVWNWLFILLKSKAAVEDEIDGFDFVSLSDDGRGIVHISKGDHFGMVSRKVDQGAGHGVPFLIIVNRGPSRIIFLFFLPVLDAPKQMRDG